MKKTICDICEKEIPTTNFVDDIDDMKFCISSYGRIWDICTECRAGLDRFIAIRKAERRIPSNEQN